jgi:hypothetical protein
MPPEPSVTSASPVEHYRAGGMQRSIVRLVVLIGTLEQIARRTTKTWHAKTPVVSIVVVP